MSLSPKDGFILLKQKLREQVEQTLSIRKELKDWSIQDIHDFQADLETKCKSSISEKWFYTHFKNENEKLPRVDVLNLLSHYCDYPNWETFLFENVRVKKEAKPKKRLPISILGLIVIGLILGLNYDFSKDKVYVIFKDAYTQRILKPSELDIIRNSKNAKWKTGDSGILINNAQTDSFTVSGPYYKETKILVEQEDDTLTIKLLPDDYALMLNFFSRSDVKNIEKRESQLTAAIHSEAKIFQVYDEFEGLELLNKSEFIERLILPVNFLKNLEVLDIQYKDEQIYRLRFRQNIKRK